MITSIGSTQKLIASNVSTTSNDSTTLVVNSEDLYVFRRYVTELEYKESKNIYSNIEITLLKSKTALLESSVKNYSERLTLANNTLSQQIKTQEYKDMINEERIKNSRKLGRKEGVVVGAVATLITILAFK